MNIKHVLVVAGLAALTLDVASQSLPTSAIIRWTPPTEYEDGSALFEQDINHYVLYCNGSVLRNVPSIIGTYSTTVTTAELGSGTSVCGMSTVTVESGVEIESILSNEVSFSLGHRTAKPPVVTVEVGV